MKKINNNILIYILLLITFFCCFGLYNNYYAFDMEEEETIRDLPEISESDELRVIIASNFIDYFVYNGHPNGFYLEILERFAAEHNLKLKIIEESDAKKSIELLNSLEADIFASQAKLPERLEKNFLFTVPLRETVQLLIQRKPDDYIYMSTDEVENQLVRNIFGLFSKKVYTKKSKFPFSPLSKLLVTEIDSISIEQIVKNVSDKGFDYAICDYHIAKILNSYYPNLDIGTCVSDTQQISWVIRKKSPILYDTLNVWLTKFKETKEYDNLLRKYITNNRFLINVNSIYYSGNEGRISEFDELLKDYCEIIDWDWRLLSSLVYEESKFDPNAESWAGAFGLMQMMPYTYESLSNDTTWHIVSQVEAGVKYIKYLYNCVPDNVTDSVCMLKMVLAGYNIGFGHVEDAIRLAEKYEKDPNSWNDISYYLTNLSNSKYYTDSVVKFGYFPGILAVDYANSVYNRYLHYRNVIPN